MEKQEKDFYKALQETLKDNFALEVVEKSSMQVPIGMANPIVNINQDLEINVKIKSLLGLLITLTAQDVFGKEKAVSMFSIQDMVYITNKLCGRYYNVKQATFLPKNKENTDKILNRLDEFLKKYY